MEEEVELIESTQKKVRDAFWFTISGSVGCLLFVLFDLSMVGWQQGQEGAMAFAAMVTVSVVFFPAGLLTLLPGLLILKRLAKSKNPEFKVLWVVGTLFIPVIGLIAGIVLLCNSVFGDGVFFASILLIHYGPAVLAASWLRSNMPPLAPGTPH